MHRRNLLRRLETYMARYPEEGEVSQQLQEFVAANPRCFERDCAPGHITGSAWLVDPSGTRLLLTHHKKLGMWLQLGGHSDGDPDTLQVAMREANEEGGVGVEALGEDIFDIDIHTIPARKQAPAHLHFDVRFALRADSAQVVRSEESNALAWVAIEEIENYTQEVSILRMRDKWYAEKRFLYQ